MHQTTLLLIVHPYEQHLQRSYQELETRLESQDLPLHVKKGAANRKYVSTTDPEASVVKNGSRSKLRYKVHRAVDEQTEIITAVETTPGEMNEAHCLTSLLEQHDNNTGLKAKTVVADSKYGTVDNFLSCHDRGIQAHIPDLKQTQKSRRKDIFSEERFEYNCSTDTYTCPAGEQLPLRKHRKKRQAFEYSCTKKMAHACPLRTKCTK